MSQSPPRSGLLILCRMGWIPDEAVKMVKKMITVKLSIYVSQKKMEERPVERLMKLGAKKDRSINYLVAEAILEYLNREEKNV